MIKRAITVICCIIMIITTGVDAFAASSPVVHAETTKVAAGEDVKIPVTIKDNPGLMGFHIKLKYDPDKITVTNVTEGDITKGGLFSQSLDMKKDSFDVIWSSSENITADGSIFDLYVRGKKGFDGKSTIKMSIVPDDTYNENMENVSVKCKNIKIKSSGSDKKETGENNDGDDPQEAFYTKEISDELSIQLSENDASDILQSVLEEEGARDINELDPKKAGTVLDKVISKMKEEGLDTGRLESLVKEIKKNSDVDADRIAKEVLDTVNHDSLGTTDADEPSIDVEETVGHKPNSVLIVIAGVALAIGAIALILFIKKK